MRITFLKDHPSGISAGDILSLSDTHAERLIAEGYVDDPEGAGAKEDKPLKPEPKENKNSQNNKNTKHEKR